MTEHTLHFVSGLPRAGSTLLCNILCQNPRIHATNTSGCLDIVWNMRNHWDTLIEHQAHPEPEAKLRCMRATLQAYHADIEKPIVFDKGRCWVAYIELIQALLDRNPKILVPVRDLRDVIASFEKLYRSTIATNRVAMDAANYFDFQTVAGRCDVWVRKDNPIGLAFNRIQDAVQRGFRDCLHFVEYEQLTCFPKETMQAIYDFIEEPGFEHNFDNVEQVTWEDDRVHGFGAGLHDIRPKVAPQPPSYPTILGKVAERYATDSKFWQTF